MRVGVFGGSFNPVHAGHRHVADAARRKLGLHKVIWLVSPQNPLKEEPAAPLERRLAQIRAVASAPTDIVTALETDLGTAYTVETLAWLARRYRGVRFFWLMGSDNLIGLTNWRRWTELSDLAEVVVVPRPGSTVRGRLAPGGVRLRKSVSARFLEAPLRAESSTALRERAKARS
jgi:nicotinate-nucleotide adenylyltransferase